MASRTRTRNTGHVTGTCVHSTGSTKILERPAKSEKCTDVVGEMFNRDGSLKDHLFELDIFVKDGNIVNGRTIGNPPYSVYSNWPLDMSVPSTVRFSSGEREDLRLRLLSQTGPLTPKVNLPLFVFELKDIPMMLKHAGDLLHKIARPSSLNLLKEGAAATLAYQFGWKTLIVDLIKLCNFADLVAKRDRELAKAHSSIGLKRKVSLPPKTSQSTRNNVIISSVTAQVVRANITDEFRTEMWGTIRWKARSDQGLGTRPKPSWLDAFRSALGLNLGQIPITIWKALPWSWMFDWFYNLSGIMQATYNMIYYSASAINIMEKRTVTSKHQGGKASRTDVSPCVFQRIEKRRTPIQNTSALTRMKLPYLDNFKLSILSSLAILRIYRR